MNTSVVAAGEGKSIWVVGDRYTIKASGKDTGGAFTLIESIVPPGSGPPPHSHAREDEAFYVIDGQIELHVDGRTFHAGPGTWITLAKGSVHYFKNTGSAPAHMLILAVPAGLDEFFVEVGRESKPGESGPVLPTPEDIQLLIATAPKYGITIVPPPE